MRYIQYLYNFQAKYTNELPAKQTKLHGYWSALKQANKLETLMENLKCEFYL